MKDKTKDLACILAVDDDARTLESLRLTLHDAYHFLATASGEQALEILSKKIREVLNGP